MLQHYRPGARQLVITMYDEFDCHAFVPRKHAGAGDFVVITEATKSVYAHGER